MSEWLCVYMGVFYLSPGTEAEIKCVGQHTPLSFWCKLSFFLGFFLPVFLETEPLGSWGRRWCEGLKDRKGSGPETMQGTLHAPLPFEQSAVFGSQCTKLELSVDQGFSCQKWTSTHITAPVPWDCDHSQVTSPSTEKMLTRCPLCTVPLTSTATWR